MTNTTWQERREIWSKVDAAMKVTVPEGTSGDVSVRRFTVAPEHRLGEMLSMMKTGRGVPAGEYTGLYRRGGLWMSDTPDEQRDHSAFLHEVIREGDRDVLVTGLGLGMVVAGLTQVPTVKRVTVVDIDEDVIALVGPHLQEMFRAADKTLEIIVGDARDPKSWDWPSEAQWDSAWHDIWKDLCTDNLAEMASMSRRYARRVAKGRQGFWGRELLRDQRRREQRYDRAWRY